jgi:hypothetical protein
MNKPATEKFGGFEHRLAGKTEKTLANQETTLVSLDKP